MNIQPWYKQFWPCFIFAIPAISVLLSGMMVYVAVSSPNDLVKEDYYKEGLAINRELSKRQLAIDNEIQASLQIDSLTGEVLITTKNVKAETLQLHFNHVIEASRDFQINLIGIADNYYRGSLANGLSGKWNLILESVHGWQLIGRLDTNTGNKLVF